MSETFTDYYIITIVFYMWYEYIRVNDRPSLISSGVHFYDSDDQPKCMYILC